MIVPVILAGGAGTRLWPLSRQAYPKQFLKLVDDKYTMFQLTLKRLEKLSVPVAPPIIVCNEDHRFIVAEQLRQLNINDASIILEPYAKNTAPAITLATLRAEDLYPKEEVILFILASDHFIDNISAFHQSITNAYFFAKKNYLAIFGVMPSEANTGYGYIQLGEQVQNNSVFTLKKFVEKPNKETAERYLFTKQYLWNSGMFMFKSDVIQSELQKYSPQIYKFCKLAWESKRIDVDFLRINEMIFKDCPDKSIDYAVMEQTEKGVIVSLNSDWNDLGTWSSLWKSNQKDSQENVSIGDVLVQKSRSNYVYSSSRLVTVLGVENLIIVETKDAILVAHQNYSQDIKCIVEDLKSEKRQELIQHKEAFRPWGKYDSIDVGERYQVKRITVLPKAKLSLQLHHHRAEHWIVVKGTAKVTKGDQQYFITENESTFIPLGVIHSIENPGSIPLELIEVQSGSYLGEDDIIRFKDEYGRT